jgi:enoyl-CoA hydratase/carnithine racemase
VHLGVLPGTGGTQRLSRIVGKARAIELMAEGSTFEFERAVELGLVQQILPEDGFFDRVMDYARRFVPPGKAARAVGLIKRAVQSGTESGFHEGLALERELQQQLFCSEDAVEGLAAYLDKRKAEFKAR